MSVPLDNWTQNYFGSSTVNIDPAQSFTGDGVANLLKFAFGMDPTASGGSALQYGGPIAGGGTINATGMPVTLIDQSGPYVVFVRLSNYASAGLAYTVQFTSDLANWQTSAATPTVLADNGTFQVVSVPFPQGVNGGQFCRVAASVVP
jgi:hypothetical protein